MNTIPLATAKARLAQYVEAKDNNRPALIHAAFAPDASLTFSIDTDSISFPPKAEARMPLPRRWSASLRRRSSAAGPTTSATLRPR